jgi:hypothetical protein
MVGNFSYSLSSRKAVTNRVLRLCASVTLIFLFLPTILFANEHSSKLAPVSIQLNSQRTSQSADYDAAIEKKSNDITVPLTSEEKTWIHDHPVVRYGGEKEWPPYDFVDEDGKHTGLSRDMLELIAK